MESKKTNFGWVAFLVSGIVAIGYGVLAIMLADNFKDILEVVIRISGICIASTGVLFLVAAIIRMTKKLPWGLILLEAIALIAVGVLSSIYAAETLTLLVILIGIWSAIVGAFMLLVTSRAKNLWNKGFYIVSAVLSIAFGVLLLLVAHPFGDKPLFIDLSGIIALVFGIIMMMFAFAIRRADKEIMKGTTKETVEDVQVQVIE